MTRASACRWAPWAPAAAVAAVLLGARPAPAAPPLHPVAPVRLAPAAADSVRRAIEADRAQTERWLRSDTTSYLAAMARVDFGDSTSLTVGRAPDCAVRVDDPAIAAHLLRVTVAGDSFHVAALDPGATFRAGGVETRDAVLPPSSIRVDRFALRLSHQRFPAIIVFDPKSPRFSQYHGLSWYPVNLAYRFVAPLTTNPRSDTTIIMSTRGNARRAVLAGWFDLLVEGRPVRLEAHRLLEPGVDEASVSVFFRDATSGNETYGVGRYVDPERLPDGRWLVDLNQAYNPACAVSPFYNCPIPSRANRLAIPIHAGERDAHYAAH